MVQQHQAVVVPGLPVARARPFRLVSEAAEPGERRCAVIGSPRVPLRASTAEKSNVVLQLTWRIARCRCWRDSVGTLDHPRCAPMRFWVSKHTGTRTSPQTVTKGMLVTTSCGGSCRGHPSSGRSGCIRDSSVRVSDHDSVTILLPQRPHPVTRMSSTAASGCCQAEEVSRGEHNAAPRLKPRVLASKLVTGAERWGILLGKCTMTTHSCAVEVRKHSVARRGKRMVEVHERVLLHSRQLRLRDTTR